jgi:Uri superfamily endonuclease
MIRSNNVIFLENLPMKGVYSLIIWQDSETSLQIRKLGCFTLQRGYYAYTGTALGNGATSLRRRIARHLRKAKIKHWHIDFFLANKNAQVTAIVAAESNARKECEVNNFIKKIEGTTIPIKGFGSSDCRHKCGSHLVYLGEERVKEEIEEIYRHLFGYCNVLDSFQNQPLG